MQNACTGQDCGSLSPLIHFYSEESLHGQGVVHVKHGQGVVPVKHGQGVVPVKQLVKILFCSYFCL